MLDILKEMNKLQTRNDKAEESKFATTAFKLTLEGNVYLTDSENEELTAKHQGAGGPTKLKLED